MVSTAMKTPRKITVVAAEKLIEKVQEVTKVAVAPTVRAGLQILAASQVYDRLRGYKGKVRFSRTADKLKVDR